MSEQVNNVSETPAPTPPSNWTLLVVFDPATQDVSVQFNSHEFRTWEFVAAVLGMAADKAKFMVSVGNMERVQRAEMERRQAEALRQMLRGHPGPQR